MSAELEEKFKSMTASEKRIEHGKLEMDIMFRKRELEAMKECLERLEKASNQI